MVYIYYIHFLQIINSTYINFIRNKLDEANTNKKQIKLIGISGHNGIIGNEITDKYAKIAVSDTGTNVIDLQPYDELKNSTKTNIKINGRYYGKAKPLN